MLEVDILRHQKLQQANAIKELIYGANLERGFSYGSVNNDVLTLFFTHPAYTHEFAIKQNEYMQSFRKTYKEKKLKDSLYFKSVVAKSVFREKKQEQKSVPEYKESSSGEFKILAKNEKIRSLFEDIQSIIKAKK